MNPEHFLEPTLNESDYDDVVEEDKRTFCQYYCQKVKENQMIANIFFSTNFMKPKSIIIALFIINIDIYFLINGLFYSDSCISERFNSTEKETMSTFIHRLIDRFLYCTIIVNIIAYFFRIIFIEEITIKKIILANKNDFLKLKYEMTMISEKIIKRIKILVIINYIIIIFSWYYLSCFYNVYPNINTEWILSSIFIFIIIQIIPLILSFIETTFRFISIKIESEKLFKLSLFLS